MAGSTSYCAGLLAQASRVEVRTELVIELLIIASVVALATKRSRFPYTVALTVVGIGVSFLRVIHPVMLSKEVVLLVFLPPLLFEGTLAMDLATLRSRWAEVLVLALPVTLLSVAAVALPIHWIFGLDLRWCLLLGAILAPTDPVSVIALFKEAGVSKKLAIVVEGESCFNDGVGVVLYLIFLGAVQGTDVTAGAGIELFAVEVAGGLAVGGVLGYLTFRLLARIDDHLLEVMISLVLAYGAYLASERLGVSGVMAVVAAGLIMGNYGKVLAMSPTTRLALTHFWEVMGFLANSLIFLLMGIAIESANIVGSAAKIGVIYVALLLGRAILVHGAGLLLAAVGRGMPVAWRHLIAWSGLRGALCVALAMGLPAAFPSRPGGDPIPSREETLAIVSGVVLLSMLIQGLTVKGVLARLGLSSSAGAHEEELEVAVARRLAYVAAGQELQRLRDAGRVPAPLAEELAAAIERHRELAHAKMAELLREHGDLERMRRDDVSRSLLLAARTAVDESFRRGMVSAGAAEHVGAELDARLEAEDGPRVVPPEDSSEAPAGVAVEAMAAPVGDRGEGAPPGGGEAG